MGNFIVAGEMPSRGRGTSQRRGWGSHLAPVCFVHAVTRAQVCGAENRPGEAAARGSQAGRSLLCGPGATRWTGPSQWGWRGVAGSWLDVVRGSSFLWGLLMVVCGRAESKMALKCVAWATWGGPLHCGLRTGCCPSDLCFTASRTSVHSVCHST